jgi:hypothetical protein
VLIYNYITYVFFSDQFIGQPARKKHKDDTKDNDIDTSDEDMEPNGINNYKALFKLISKLQSDVQSAAQEYRSKLDQSRGL